MPADILAHITSMLSLADSAPLACASTLLDDATAPYRVPRLLIGNDALRPSRQPIVRRLLVRCTPTTFPPSLHEIQFRLRGTSACAATDGLPSADTIAGLPDFPLSVKQLHFGNASPDVTIHYLRRVHRLPHLAALTLGQHGDCLHGPRMPQIPRLPPSLRSLHMGPCRLRLPQTPPELTRLVVGRGYRRSPPLPSTLQHLEMAWWMPRMQPLPAGLRVLRISKWALHLGAGAVQYPKGLQELHIKYFDSFSLADLPKTLQHLRLPDNFDRPISQGSLPLGLATLHTGALFTSSLPPGALPSTLRRLHLGEHFNIPFVQDVLPPGLTHLIIGGSFDRPLTRAVLPTGLVSLTIGHASHYNRFRNVIELPAHLQHLSLTSTRWDEQLPALPGSLRTLHLDCDCSIDGRTLPDGLTHLHIGQHVQHYIRASELPSTVHTVTVSDAYPHLHLLDLPCTLVVHVE